MYISINMRYLIKQNLKKFFRQNNYHDFRLCEYLKKSHLDEQDKDELIDEVSINHNVAQKCFFLIYFQPHIEKYFFLIISSFINYFLKICN